jgi:phosphoribosyl-AMP cyclohydrolase
MTLDEPAVAALLDAVAWTPSGLVSCVAQQHDTGEVLMVAWMDRAAIRETLATRLVELRLDCDGDALLALVDQAGAACHTGRRSCFYRAARDGALAVIADPIADPAELYGRSEAAP